MTSNRKVMEQMLKVFYKFDTDRDGKLSMSDLGLVLNSLGSKTSPAQVRVIMAEIDTDGDGLIDFNEFETFYLADDGGKGTNEKELRDAFNIYDKDKNGKISADELFAVMKSLGEKCSIKDCRKMINSVDIDGDGFVDFEEFKKMMAI